MEDAIDKLINKKTEVRKKGIGRMHIRVGYWYDQLARKELEHLGEKSPRKFMLVEGAGKIAIHRIKRYGVEKVCKMLKEYIASEKFLQYPRLTAALSADTITKIEMDRLK